MKLHLQILVTALFSLTSCLIASPVFGQLAHTGNTRIDGKLSTGERVTASDSFGPNQFIIRDNEIRIRFDDVVVPNIDWGIELNALPGGNNENYFAIVDQGQGTDPTVIGTKVFRVDSGAPVNAMRITSTGNVGLGTSMPSADLHVVETTSGSTSLRLEAGNGEAYEFSVDPSLGFFLQDVNTSVFPFSISPTAGDNVLHLASNGIGINTSTVSGGDTLDGSILDVKGSGSGTDRNARVSVDPAVGGFGEFLMQQDNANQWSFGNFMDRYYIFEYRGINLERFTINNGGNIGFNNNNPQFDLHIGKGAGSSGIDAGSTTFTIGSSRTEKENLVPVKAVGILEKISDVGVFTYDYIDGPKDKLGLMAEDFHTVFQRGSDKSINGQDVQMALWLAVQELEKQVVAGDELTREQGELIREQGELVKNQGELIKDLRSQLAEQKAVAQQARIEKLEALLAANEK